MAQSDWQPIETAPRDGDTVLLCVQGHVTVGGWLDRAAQDIEEYEPGAWEGWWTLDADEGEPTHWMPLPSPPESEGESDV